MSANAHPSVRLAVVGAGAWGTVLAVLLQRRGAEVVLWTRREAHARELRAHRENRAYLPGLPLPAGLSATSDPAALGGCEAALVAVPSRGLRTTLALLPPLPSLISCSKGLEIGSFKRFSEVIGEYQPQATLAALSGPNLADEIAAGKPAAAVVASYDRPLAERVQGWLQGRQFRVYTSPDLVGVELGGALKNVIALAAGMCDGLALGDNAKATIITRGLAEVIRLGRHLGGRPETFYGLSGLGDMVATCASRGSRNHAAGERIARGDAPEALERERLTAEGIPTVAAVHDYGARTGLDLPICNEVYRVVFERKAPADAIADLMGRETKPEW